MESAHRENDPSPSFERPDPRVVREFGRRRRRPGMYFTGRCERDDRPRRSRDCTACRRPGLARSDQTGLLIRIDLRIDIPDQLAGVSQTG